MCNRGILCGCSYVILITLLQLALIFHDKYAVAFNADSETVINIQANRISSKYLNKPAVEEYGGGECGERKDALMLALEARVKTRIKDRRYAICSLSLSFSLPFPLFLSFSLSSLCSPYYIFYLSALDRDDFR